MQSIMEGQSRHHKLEAAAHLTSHQNTSNNDAMRAVSATMLVSGSFSIAYRLRYQFGTGATHKEEASHLS